MDPTYTIAEVARCTGLSKDTLRWYETEGLVTGVGRDANGHRVYDGAAVRMIQLVIRLRRTGMPIREARDFAETAQCGPDGRGQRLALLEAHRLRVLAQLAQLEEDLETIDLEISHCSEVVAGV